MINAKAIDAMERVAHNLPVQTLDYCRVPTEWGLVYIAIGRGPSSDPEMGFISWQGVYGIRYGVNGVARLGEVSGNASKAEALQHFLGDAVSIYKLFDERGMLDESYRLNG